MDGFFQRRLFGALVSLLLCATLLQHTDAQQTRWVTTGVTGPIA